MAPVLGILTSSKAESQLSQLFNFPVPPLTKTDSLTLAEEYLRLGGRRRAKVDDNIVSTRQWEADPAEAEAFWKERVETLDKKQQQEVEIHLPSISDD